ncbi:DUF6891 domain-containing protein [Promicromonospora sp. NPDC019610]|uniref:DUF6891 domain-containing protein n=1 Tax=Promicromonospora sp. NPDC019610 TaxID=3364405 RepID=UPI0037912F7D
MDVAPLAGGNELKYVREQARAMVRAGFTPFDRVLQAADDMLEPDVADSLRTAAAEAVREEWQARVAEQASWADEGDYSALAAAFADLESQGVVARMCFACCTTCGVSEIRDEADRKGREPLGYVFFHSQDADRIADAPGDLFLSFGGFGDLPAVAVGEILTTTVTRHGLEVEWTGDPRSKVRVRVTDWRKRLPADVSTAAPARWRVRPERGAATLDPTPYDLLMLFHQVRSGRQQFFAVEDTANEYRFAQATVDGEGPAFVVEYREGSDTPIYQATCPDLMVAHQVLVGWATDVAGWRDLAGWTQFEL